MSRLSKEYVRLYDFKAKSGWGASLRIDDPAGIRLLREALCDLIIAKLEKESGSGDLE